jgi:hypothetical protein
MMLYSKLLHLTRQYQYLLPNSWVLSIHEFEGDDDDITGQEYQLSDGDLMLKIGWRIDCDCYVKLKLHLPLEVESPRLKWKLRDYLYIDLDPEDSTYRIRPALDIMRLAQSDPSAMQGLIDSGDCKIQKFKRKVKSV